MGRARGAIYAVIASAAKQSTLVAREDGLLRGACHRARIRATRWLAMTSGLPSRGGDGRVWRRLKEAEQASLESER